GTPKPIVDKLHAEVNKMLQTPAMREAFAAQGVLPMVMSQAELASFIKSEIAKWGKAVKDSGAKAE
ncbi:tripartite tricarboxylate transporter substrate binding protein, partial [Cylindrospermopsis raciborskii CS-506_C]